MQPFARPTARLVWSHARLGLDRTTRPNKTSWGTTAAAAQSSAICLRCSIRAIGSSARWYSTHNSSGDREPRPTSRTDKDVEAELQSILKPRPIIIPHVQPQVLRLKDPKIDCPKLDDVKPESSETYRTTIHDSMPEDASPKPQSETKDTPSRAEVLRNLAQIRLNELTQRFSQAMDNLQSRAMNASKTLNDITGYTGIEGIKRQNAEIETSLADAHVRVRSARQAYKTSNARRAATQREVTTLLARKDSWSPGDLERFTELYRTDHVLEGEVVSSQEALTEAEADEQSLSQRLNAGILKRYHEEQIWSDRIRRASTWGTWGLMGMNFVLFVILQFVAEPWKRRRLVKGVVAEEKAVLEEVRGELEQVKLALERREEAVLAQALPDVVYATDDHGAGVAGEALAPEAFAARQPPMTEEAPIERLPDVPERTWEEVLRDPEWWRAKAEDLCSERRIDLRMRDASLLALEGALAGAVMAGSIVLLLAKRS